MAAEAVGHRVFRVFAHGAAAHHVGTAQARAEELQAQAVDQLRASARVFT
jgi:putative effector of murein hydrolase